MKLAILSDSHDRVDHIKLALEKAKELHCEALLHAGDIICPLVIKCIGENFSGKSIIVFGNNDGERLGIVKTAQTYPQIHIAGDVYEGVIDNKKIYMNHYPNIVKPIAKSEQYDVCIYGHTHIYEIEKYGKTLSINPGELMGDITGTVGFVVFDTNTNNVERIILSKAKSETFLV